MSSQQASEAQPAASDEVVTTAIILWCCGLACATIMCAVVVAPLKTLLTAIRAAEGSAESKESISTLCDRNDEFGSAAIRLKELDERRSARLTEFQQNESEFRESWTKLNAVLQAMSEGVVAIDADEKIQFANLAVCGMLDFTEGQVEGRLLFEVARNSHLQETVKQSLEEQKKTSVEFKVARTGSHLSLVTSPLPTGGAVLVLADVTGVRKLENMRRDFVGGVSHELKTPLTVIQACTETLLDGAIADPDAGPRFLRQIEEQSERLLHLIIAMMELARLESGEQVFRKEPVDLRRVVNKVASNMETVASNRSLTLSVSGADELFVLADFQAVRTIISNLVDNALKYSKEGGEVTVDVTANETTHSVRVIDDGHGIPEADRERVFERFFRVERDRNSDRGGTGMGLAIVKHLSQAMGAELSLESRIGMGTTITISFPVED